MEFELIEIKGVTAPKLNEQNTELSIFALATIGVVGMPNEPKYFEFRKIVELEYSWDITLPSDVALAGLQTFGENYVSTNYPTI
jgi:hypothetical protein